MIPPEHVQNVCQPGAGATTCRYLMLGEDGWWCAKETSMGDMLDGRVAAGLMTARGDNCPGYSKEKP